MKKVLLIIVFVILSFNIMSCSDNKVSKSQIKQDLEEKFVNEGLTVNDVEIDLLKAEGIQNVIHVTVDMNSPEATLTRKYVVIYEHYEVGGWVLKECNATDEEQWVAYPHEIYITDEIICDVIFAESTKGGYYIKSSPDQDKDKEIFSNRKFRYWTEGSTSELPKTNNLESYEITQQSDGNSRATVVANCRAYSDIIEIAESFKIEFLYDPVTLTWIATSGESISNNYEFLIDLTGDYYNQHDDDDILSVNYINNKLNFSRTKEFSNSSIEVEGLFSMDLCHEKDDDRIAIYSAPMRISIGPVYFSYTFYKK